MDAQASSSTGSSDVSGGWSTATAIGCLAGVPTAAFLQIGFIKTLRQRNVAVAVDQPPETSELPVELEAWVSILSKGASNLVRLCSSLR